MSGHEKTRAVVLTVMMVMSVFAAGVAFTGGAAAQEETDERTTLDLEVTPDTVTPGEDPDTVLVEVTNGDPANETYDYTVTGPGLDSPIQGDSADDVFSFSVNPETEGQYEITVTAQSDDPDLAGDSGTATVTSAYNLAVQPTEVAAGDYTQVIEGQITNDQGEGVSGQTLTLRDTDGDALDPSTSDANGQVSFSFMPDQSGEYPITNEDGSITYETITATPNELTVESNRTQLLFAKTDTTDFTVSADGEQLTGDELENLDPDITQSGEQVASDGSYVDTNDDDEVDTYRVDIQPSAGAIPVNATFSNETFEGSTQIEVLQPNVQVDQTSPFTKGVRTPVELTATDPRDGEPISENSEVGIDVDGGTFEAQSDEVSVEQTNGSTSGNALELEDDEYAIISEQDGADDNDVFDINATVIAFNESAGTSEGLGDSDEESREAFNQSVITHVVAAAGDSPEPEQPTQAATQPAETDSVFDGIPGLDPTDYTFEPLNADASPDEIPVTGESPVTVNTSDAQGEDLPRGVDLHLPNGDFVEGNTGDDGQITFSVNPDQTGTITQNTYYEDGFDVGDSNAPFEVQTDTIEVVEDVDEEPPVGDIDAQANQDFGDVTVGESATETVTVENDGDGPVTVTETSISGTDADEFEVVGGGAPFTLEPDETQQIEVEFTPDSTGEKSADLTIDTENDGTETVSLSGTGVEEAVGEIEAPAQADFDRVTVGESMDQTVTVVNDGEASVEVIDTSIEGPNGAEFTVVDNPAGNQFDDESFTLAPGESRELTVRFAPDSAGDKSATLVIDTEDDGREEVALSGTGVEDEPDKNVITIRGEGPRTQYVFSVTDDLAKSTANGANINANDEVNRGYAADGEVGAAADSYTYNGSLETISINGEAEVFINGERLSDEDVDEMPDRAIEFQGTGPRAQYDFSSNGDEGVQKITANEANINNNDGVFRTTAYGVTGAYRDAFGFSGSLETIDAPDSVEVYVNGELANQDGFRNQVVTIAGSGPAASYDLTVDSDLRKSTANFANINANDEVDGNSATGEVGIAADSYVYNGDISEFTTDGDVTIYVDGELRDQGDV